MSGETNLSILLQSMQPLLHQGEYIFCTFRDEDKRYLTLNPISLFRENEGISLILERQQADQFEIPYTAVFSQITLSVHSSLEAVGFLAAVAAKLAENGISVNPVAGYYHDHLFVPASRAQEAMNLLAELSRFNTEE